jgi:CheY-like chemotaxis protein
MPHQDGYEFMRMVQSDAALSKIPFVFLSSSVWSIQEQERALVQGAKKFISRPIEPQMLLEQLKDCIPKRTD